MDHCACYFWELYCTRMNGLDKHLTVFPILLMFPTLSLHNFFLQREDNLINISGSDQFQNNVKCLPSNVQFIEPIKYYKLNIVVTLREKKLTSCKLFESNPRQPSEVTHPSLEFYPHLKNILNLLRSICQKLLTLWKLVYRHDSKNCVPPYIWMPVLQVAHDGRNQRFNDINLIQAAKEPQSNSTDVLIRMLQIIPQVLADQDHLRDIIPFKGFLDLIGNSWSALVKMYQQRA
nr:hypothetical protein DEO72_LG1g994 [Ipomoea batatas]